MKKQLIIISGMAIAIISVFIAVLIALKFDISEKIFQINKTKDELNFQTKTIKLLSALRSDIAAVQPYIPGIENSLPSKDQLINFSRDLNAIASQNKINIASNFTGEDLKSTGLKWIGLTASAEGEFSDLINFLKTIENSRYSVKFDKLDLNEAGKNYKMILEGKVFYF